MTNLKILLLLLFMSSGQPIYAVDEPIYGYEGYGIASYADYKELLKHPVLISSRTGTIEGENIAVFRTDYHMISDAPFYKLRSLLIDLDKASEVFSRITGSEDLTPDNSLHYPHKQEIHASFKFLGLGPEYSYRVYVYFDRNHAESAVNNLPAGISFLAGLFEGFEISRTFDELTRSRKNRG